MLAQSSEFIVPLAAGYDGDGVDASGTAHTDVWLIRNTAVTIGGSLIGGSVDLKAEIFTQSQGGLQDNQNTGAFNTVFHAGVDDSIVGHAHPKSTFTIGFDASGNPMPSGVSVEIVGSVVSYSTLTINAHAQYDIDISSFGWVTAGAGTTYLTSESYVTTEDFVELNFGDSGTATATGTATLHAGFDGSQVVLLTKIHYSELGVPNTSDTNATTALAGAARLRDNNYLSGITAPSIVATVAGMPAPALGWTYTASSDNHLETHGSHALVAGNTVATSNDWANRTSSGVMAPAPQAAENASDGSDLARAAAEAAFSVSAKGHSFHYLPTVTAESGAATPSNSANGMRTQHGETPALFANAPDDRSAHWFPKARNLDLPAAMDRLIDSDGVVAKRSVATEPKVRWAR